MNIEIQTDIVTKRNYVKSGTDKAYSLWDWKTYLVFAGHEVGVNKKYQTEILPIYCYLEQRNTVL